MLGGILAENLECCCHLLPDDVSPVAQVLKGFDPDDACFLDCVEEEFEPPPASALKEIQWEAYQTGSEDNPQFQDPEHVFGAFDDAVIFFWCAEEQLFFWEIVV